MRETLNEKKFSLLSVNRLVHFSFLITSVFVSDKFSLRLIALAEREFSW